MEKLSQLEADYQHLHEKINRDELLNQAILTKLAQLDDFSNLFGNKLSHLEDVSNEICFKINDQLHSHSQLNDKLAIQDVYHQTILERLDQQDATSHKINYQLENLKAIVFERIGDLAEKVETQGKLTYKYLTSLFSKNDLSTKVKHEEKEVILINR